MIGTYIVTAGSRSDVVTQMTSVADHQDPDAPEIKYLRGVKLEFKLRASLLLQAGTPSESKSLWAKHGAAYGSTDWDTAAPLIGTNATCGKSGQENYLATRAAAADFYHLDTNVRVTAMNTGARVDIPIVVVKSENFVTSCERS